ncbi:hypothetical protein CYY_008103 [Polysphondylium violaceum]|uniref:FNIP repeat-containing protein n=1 Tax=Polysphondylium violaceum TaxID=133409 RepID=A0A8J4PNM8_9MYCE|nr:hypothetical protein CYY_008103 [Polysphondylium violaceum]
MCSFILIWRNKYLKDIIIEYLYALLESSVKCSSSSPINRYRHYCLSVDSQYDIQFINRYDRPRALIFNHYFSVQPHKLIDIVPRSVTRLKVELERNNPIPPWVTTLFLKEWTAVKNGDIPKSVTDLTLCSMFRSDNLMLLKGKIPGSVKKLAIPSLDKEISHIIPKSVTHLTLLKQPINSINDRYLPSWVKHITLGTLCVSDADSHSITPSLSARLGGTYFICTSATRANIPRNTTHLIWMDYTDDQGISAANVPSGVHTLILGEKYNAPIQSLPPSITQMIFTATFELPLSSISFPPTLKHLRISLPKETVIKASSFPATPLLSHLSLDQQCFIESLPPSVHHLQLHSGYTGNKSFPSTVKHLKVISINQFMDIPSTIQSVCAYSPSYFTYPHPRDNEY